LENNKNKEGAPQMPLAKNKVKFQHDKNSKYPFRSTDREHRSYYDILPKNTPTINRYNPNYLNYHQNHSPAYSIQPETVGVEVRRPVTLKRPCIDENDECSLGLRLA
jgi:hypothetical protein